VVPYLRDIYEAPQIVLPSCILTKDITIADHPTSCLTDHEEPCIFPFIYKGLTYTKCTNIDESKGAWCATKLDANGATQGRLGIDSNYCSETCVTI